MLFQKIPDPYFYRLNGYMKDDMEFCMCGCSSDWHNLKRLCRMIFINFKERFV